MLRWIMITILSIGIAGVAFWGYKEHQEKNAILIQAENTYQRSFHELSYHMDLLHEKIGTTLAMNTQDQLSPQLVEIWRITSEALSNVGQLPLALLPFNETEEFLSNIGDFTYRTAVRDLDKTPLSTDETATLQSLYEQSGHINKELRQVQHMVLDNNLRWMDVQLALVSTEEQTDNTIIDGFKTVEKKVGGYSESNVNSLIGTSSKDHEYLFLDGKKINEKEAMKRGKELLAVKNEKNMTITKSGKGAEIPMYSISYDNGDKHGYMDMSVKGGHPISFLIDRPINEKKISLNDGLKKAEQYLKDNEFEGMQLYQSSEFNNIGVYSFLFNDNGIRVYSDAIELKVGLDDGEVLGVTAKNYFMNHTKRDIPKPKIDLEEAKSKVNSKVKVQEDYMAIIENDLGEEVLTYEFLGTLDNETYRIFINAADGSEEKVEKLGGTEMSFA